MPEITFLYRMKETPDLALNIYRLASPAVTTKSLYLLAEKFGIKEPKIQARIQSEEKRLVLAKDKFILQYHRATGAIRFFDQTRWMIDDQHSNIEMSDKKAIALAKEVITKYKLADEAEYKLVKVTHLHVGSMDEKQSQISERVIDVGVIFQRQLDGIPVLGPGGKIMVYLDAKGELTGIEQIWRPVKELHAKVESFRAPQLAEKQMVRFLKQRSIENAQVEDVEIAYFEFGWNSKQTYLQPAYVFKLNIPLIGADSFMKSAFVVEAATNAVGTLLKPVKKPVEQVPRK